MELKETTKKISEVFHYLSAERFESLMKIKGFNEKQIKEYSPLIKRGVTNFIIEAPQEIIDVVLDFNLDLSFKKISFYGDYDNFFVKIIYKVIDSDTFKTEEINLTSYYGNKLLVSIHENPNNEIIATCRMTDEISKRDKTVKLFEGDLVSTQAYDYGSNKNCLIMCFLDKTYIGGDPYYRELLWTDKYGYLAPNSKTEPNLDNTPIILNESSFNVKGNRYNYHKITLAENFKIIGNINIDYNLLKPQN